MLDQFITAKTKYDTITDFGIKKWLFIANMAKND